MVWRRVNGEERDVEFAALGVIETLTMHLQLKADAPRVLRPRARTFPGQGQQQPLQQAASPVSYVVDPNEIVRWSWANSADASIRLELRDGRQLELPEKTCVRDRRAEMLNAVEPQPTKRRQARVMHRPGRGGITRRPRDPFEALDQYGTCHFMNYPGSARVCVVDIAAADDATTLILTRNSAEEKEKRLRLQVEPCWHIADHLGLKVRTIIAATHMSGTRVVRERHALPPPPEVLERDDMLIVFNMIERGLIENVVVRDVDRLARIELEGFKIIRRFEEAGVSLYVEGYGRKMHYKNDHKLLRDDFANAHDERDGIVRRTQRALVDKGPMVGNGWLGPLRLGLVRDAETHEVSQDEEQVWFFHKIYELADIGAPSGDASGYTGPLSCREIESYLATEYGIQVDHDKIRAILWDDTFVTGERTTNLRGVKLAQQPARLSNPIPADRAQRVRDNLGLRKGRSKKTSVGEFVLNTVETVHVQCEGAIAPNGGLVTIKGYNIKARHGGFVGRYRHVLAVPDQCSSGGRGYHGAFTWDKDVLEAPIMRALRELATHPEIVRQAALAARHEFASTSNRPSPEQRAALERELQAAQTALEDSAGAWINERMDAGKDPDMPGYLRYHEELEKRVRRLERRLADALEAEVNTLGLDGSGGLRSAEERVEAFLEILTDDMPEDDRMRRLRARLFQRIVSRVEIDDDGEGPITIHLHGHLVPDHAREDAINPVSASHELLDSYLLEREGGEPMVERQIRECDRTRAEIETDLSERPLKSVWSWKQQILSLPTAAEQDRRRRASLSSNGWQRSRSGPRRNSGAGTAAWKLSVTVA